MIQLLHINTALDEAIVSLSSEEVILEEIRNETQREHAAFLHPAIRQLLLNHRLKTHDLSAISVIIGPGSYTGLRVGLSAAKGICFASGIPLITVNTLEWMVASVLQEIEDIFCPMIDARRKEVFAALYDRSGIELIAPFAHILSEESFKEELQQKSILFFGNGAEKGRPLINHPNAHFMLKNPASSREQAEISVEKLHSANFADLAYSEPLYVKAFYTTAVPYSNS